MFEFGARFKNDIIMFGDQNSSYVNKFILIEY